MWRYTLQSIALIVLLAILIRSFIISSYVMSGGSMLPTIWPGDFILASRIHVHDVHRGDIVALRCPLVRDKLCLKRVIGVPGDHIEFKGGQLVLNGVLAKYLPTGAFQTEMLSGQGWAIWPEPTLVEEHSKKATGAVDVAPDTVYVLNDKRSEHDDSRHWGPVATSAIEAKLLGVWLSLDWYESEHVRGWPRVRWNRLFTRLD